MRPRPAPSRPSQTWATFLKTHAAAIVVCDFLHIVDVCFRQLYLFIIIELGTRRVVHVGVMREPTQDWVARQWREATPNGHVPRFVIRDNDGKDGPEFDSPVQAYGTACTTEAIHTPYRAPRANAVCERFLRSVRQECLDHLLIFSERQLLRMVKAAVEYFHHARPHQGLYQRSPCGTQEDAPAESLSGKVIVFPVLNGLHYAYRLPAQANTGWIISHVDSDLGQGEFSMDRNELIKHIKHLIVKTSVASPHSVGIHAEVCEFLRIYAGSKSAFYQKLNSADPMVIPTSQSIRPVLEGFLDYVERGLSHGISPERKVQLDVVSDYLEMAHQILETQGTHPAATVMIVGATLEEFLRTWIEAEDLPLEGRKPGLDSYSQVLCSKELITKQDANDITSWTGLRNHAAQGEWDEVSDKGRVAIMLEGVNLFMRRYMPSSS